MASAMESIISTSSEQDQSVKNTDNDNNGPVTIGATTPKSMKITEKQIPTTVEESLSKSASMAPAQTDKSKTVNCTTSLTSQEQVQSVKNKTPLTPSSTTPLPQRPQGRTRTGSAEARPFSLKGVPPGCFNTIHSVSRVSIEQGIRDLAQDRSRALATLEEEESYINRLLQTVDFCSRVVLLPTKNIMKDATNDPHRLSKNPALQSSVTNGLNNGPYIKQLKSAMKSVTDQAGETPVLEGMEVKIKETIQDNINLLNEAITNAAFWTVDYTEDEVETLFSFHILPITRKLIKNLFLKTMGLEQEKGSYELQPSPDANALEISNIKKDILSLKQEREERRAMEEKLVDTIAGLKQEATAAEFEREERKIRMDPQDKDRWSKASNEQRQIMIKDVVNSCSPNASINNKVHIWITKPGRGASLPWARITFPNSDSKYIFEKYVKEKRTELWNLPSREKFFTTQRLVPQSFISTKNEMLNQGKHKLAYDWEKLVTAQNTTSRKKWMHSRDATWRQMGVRLQFKMTPRFGVWVEGLDPCHRLCWRAIDLEDNDSFFKDYDLSLLIPDPATRAKAVEDPSFSTPRKPFKDEQSLEIKHQRPEIFKTREERLAASVKTPGATTANDVAAQPQIPDTTNQPRVIPDAIPVRPPPTKLTETGAITKTPVNIHGPPNQEKPKETLQQLFSGPNACKSPPVTDQGITPPGDKTGTTPPGDKTGKIPLINLTDLDTFPPLKPIASPPPSSSSMPGKQAMENEAEGKEPEEEGAADSILTKDNVASDIITLDEIVEEPPKYETTDTNLTKDNVASDQITLDDRVEEPSKGETTGKDSPTSTHPKELSPLQIKEIQSSPAVEDNKDGGENNVHLPKTPPRVTADPSLSPETVKLKTTSRTAKKGEKNKSDTSKTPPRDLASDEATNTPFKDQAPELELEEEGEELTLPEAPVFAQARQSGISKLQQPKERKSRQAKKPH